MRRIIALILFSILCTLSWGQRKTYPPRPWMFTLEETIQLPGVSKEEMEERSKKARKAEAATDILPGNSIIWDTINWQTRRRVIEFHPWYMEMGEGRKRYSMLMHFAIAIIPGDGSYTVQLQRLEVTAYRGKFRVYDDIIRSGESGPEIQARKRDIEPVQALAKDYARQFFNSFTSRIRQAMEHPEPDVRWEESYLTVLSSR